MAALSRGVGTLSVPVRLFAQNRQRLCAKLKESNLAHLEESAVFLQGGRDLTRYSTDLNPPAFRQESYFFWCTGVIEPDCWVAISVATGKCVLFLPKLGDDYKVWCGSIPSLEDVQQKYEVDQVAYESDCAKTLKDMGVKQLLLIDGQNTDSGLMYPPADTSLLTDLSQFKVDKTTLFPVITECRVFKSDLEIEVLRYAAHITVAAHKRLMRSVQPNMYEYQLESLFLHHAAFHAGCRHPGYTPISASGNCCAVLHYGHAAAPNDRRLSSGDLCLCDMGAEYFCYGADVTTTFPANGKFTPKQKIIYEAVLAANRAVMGQAKPGVSWVQMHTLAEETILTHLRDKAKLLKGDVSDMLAARLGATFMPHGLGHFLGLDTHDVGGYPPTGGHPPRPEGPGLSKLRTARVLEDRMYITIEPGCYFIDHLLDKALADDKLSKFLIPEELAKYRGFGGVRIEDDVLITEKGCENLTPLPREVAEIEAFMAVRDAPEENNSYMSDQ